MPEVQVVKKCKLSEYSANLTFMSLELYANSLYEITVLLISGGKVTEA
jgi:hypothetical protein